ncbi:unnamed protein product [Prunus armeniaca]
MVEIDIGKLQIEGAKATCLGDCVFPLSQTKLDNSSTDQLLDLVNHMPYLLLTRISVVPLPTLVIQFIIKFSLVLNTMPDNLIHETI